jgi:predicted phage tail protein
VTYVDTTVTVPNTYLYRVKAMSGTVSSLAYTNTASVSVSSVVVAPTSVTVTFLKDPAPATTYTATLNWTHPGNTNLVSFTILRASNATFTRNLNTFTTPLATDRTTTQTLNPNTTYYYRVRANYSIGGSSAWTNASPFPIRTGN